MIETDNQRLLEWGRKTLLEEGNAVLSLLDSLGTSYCELVRLILRCKGKIVFTGLGKSGYVAQKLAATFSSTGTHAFYLHPSEALHGDFGMIKEGDTLFALAHSGETREVLCVASYCKKNNIPVLSISGKKESSLSKLSHVSLSYKIKQEADPLGLVPTTSSTVCLALGDSIATTLMRCRNFTKAKFALLHPGGSLGRSFAKAREFMIPKEDLFWIESSSSIDFVVESLNRSNYGIVGVLDYNKKLIGVVSDGDLRRSLCTFREKFFSLAASQIMTQKPKTISENALAVEAVSLMENNKITSLFVTSDKENVPLGVLRLHDLIVAGMI